MPNTMDMYLATVEYEHATVRAFWQEMIGHLRGKPAQLLSFEDIRARLRLREELYRGLQDIPLEAIVGSVGRYTDFTNTFLPKSVVNKDRWSRIYAEVQGTMGLPPIEVYQVGEVYFVRDGNHRVSVALALGQKTIEAYVTEVDVPFCLNKTVVTSQMDAAEAYMTFLEETALRYIPQHENLMLSEPTRYNDFIGHINLHGAFLSECEECPVSIQEAATHWYQNVYLPAVMLIRKHDMLAHMKKRTEADMYLWLVEHLHQLERSYNGLVSDLTPALVSFLSKRKLPVPDELVAIAV
ncbi:MAG: hypothetical protein LCI00_00280 [Chloroflexi bacterium]|nr:hypothetical protein [Chloroflexota bacterium]MCC6894374.1 hypothetical protein [Anaerolineae bacterium]